jgi:hypothetical protein
VWLTLLQLTYVTSVVYCGSSVVHQGYYSYDIYVKGGSPEYLQMSVGMFVCPLVVFMTSFFFLPTILGTYSVNTNIEMMKDRAIVD